MATKELLPDELKPEVLAREELRSEEHERLEMVPEALRLDKNVAVVLEQGALVPVEYGPEILRPNEPMPNVQEAEGLRLEELGQKEPRPKEARPDENVLDLLKPEPQLIQAKQPLTRVPQQYVHLCKQRQCSLGPDHCIR